MTNLTDKWKKGELPSGWYWVDYYSVDGAVMLEYIPQHNGFGYDEKNLVQAVLAPVPSYEQWQASENYIDYLKQCISVYESKEKQHTDDAIAYNELAEENEKLKELLKECKHIMSIEKDFASCHFEKDKLCKLLTKISQVLGEE